MGNFDAQAARQSMIARQGATQVTSYSSEMPLKDFVTLQKGDVIVILDGIYQIPIGRKRAGEADKRPRYEANYATVYRAAAPGAQPTEIGVAPISPSVFTRSCQPVEVDTEGKFLSVKEGPRAYCKGQPVEDFMSYDDLTTAMKAMVGKPIAIVDVVSVYSYDERWMQAQKAQKRPYYTMQYLQQQAQPAQPQPTNTGSIFG